MRRVSSSVFVLALDALLHRGFLPLGPVCGGILDALRGSFRRERGYARPVLRLTLKRNRGQRNLATESGGPHLGTYLDRLHQRARKALKLPVDFVLHSLRHTMLTRLGEAGIDAFTIMRIAGHSSITVSQRYVHPSAESMERAIEKLNVRNQGKVFEVGTELGTVANDVLAKDYLSN